MEFSLALIVRVKTFVQVFNVEREYVFELHELQKELGRILRAKESIEGPFLEHCPSSVQCHGLTIATPVVTEIIWM